MLVISSLYLSSYIDSHLEDSILNSSANDSCSDHVKNVRNLHLRNQVVVDIVSPQQIIKDVKRLERVIDTEHKQQQRNYDDVRHLFLLS